MYRTAIIGSTVLVAASVTLAQQQAERGPRQQPGTTMGMYAPEQHELYDGRFIIRASRVYQVGTLNDQSPWDHMGNDASNVRPVEGEIQIDVNEIENTGTFRAELDLPEGRYVVELDCVFHGSRSPIPRDAGQLVHAIPVARST